MSGEFSVQLGNNFGKSRVSDVSTRILARMSASVSVSWNAALTKRGREGQKRAVAIECSRREGAKQLAKIFYGCGAALQ